MEYLKHEKQADRPLSWGQTRKQKKMYRDWDRFKSRVIDDVLSDKSLATMDHRFLQT